MYTGSSLDTLTVVASNDEDPGGCGGGRDYAAGSTVSFTATAGTVYHIAVDSWSPQDVGTVILDWVQVAPPPTTTLSCKVKARQPSGTSYLLCRLYDPAGVRRVNVTNTTTGLREQSIGVPPDTKIVTFKIDNDDPHRVTVNDYAGNRMRYLVASDGTTTPL